MKSFKLSVYILLSQIIGWAFVTLFDAWEEYSNGPDLLLVSCLGFPILAVAVYFIFRKKILTVCDSPAKSVCLTLFLWLAFDVAFSYPIIRLVDSNKWFIEQKRAFYLSLNGIEYMIYGTFMGLLPVIAVLVVEGIIALVKYIKARRS